MAQPLIYAHMECHTMMAFCSVVFLEILVKAYKGSVTPIAAPTRWPYEGASMSARDHSCYIFPTLFLPTMLHKSVYWQLYIAVLLLSTGQIHV